MRVKENIKKNKKSIIEQENYVEEVNALVERTEVTLTGAAKKIKQISDRPGAAFFTPKERLKATEEMLNETTQKVAELKVLQPTLKEIAEQHGSSQFSFSAGSGSE